MITLTQKYNNFLCSLLLNLKIRFKEYQELITAKYVANTPIHLVVPFWVSASFSYRTRKRYFFSKPVDYTKICVSYLYGYLISTWSRYMAVCVEKTGDIADLISRKIGKINFNFFKANERICTFMRAVFTLTYFYFTRLGVKCLTTTQTLFRNFGFCVSYFSEFIGNTTRALSRAKSLLSSSKGFLAFFACFHRIRIYKLITECKGKNYEK